MTTENSFGPNIPRCLNQSFETSDASRRQLQISSKDHSVLMQKSFAEISQPGKLDGSLYSCAEQDRCLVSYKVQLPDGTIVGRHVPQLLPCASTCRSHPDFDDIHGLLRKHLMHVYHDSVPPSPQSPCTHI